ncbi:MAG: phage tail protein [Lachnospiraceae bacterium]|nr:phage tail protein [Lachnospiraceae bacterium]
MSETKENKVQFNLKNVHYAIPTAEGGWGAPVHVPGAVTLILDPQGEVTPFYADGIVFYNSVSNNGYSGNLDMAKFPDQMQKDIWKCEETTDGVLIENINVEPSSFALLYQIDGDVNNDYYCLYNCTGTRPGIGGTTNTNTKDPQTKSSTISAVPLKNGNVLARTTAKTTAEVKNNWFNKVYEKPSTTEETTTE